MSDRSRRERRKRRNEMGITAFFTMRPLIHKTSCPDISRMLMTEAKDMLQGTGIGTIRAMTYIGKLVILTKVLLVPKLAASLISLSKILTTGKSVEERGRTVRMYDHRHTNLNFVLK